MMSIRSLLFVVFICFWYSYAKADTSDLQSCEAHLNKYRKFLLQAILSFEDVCDAYNTRASPLVDTNLPAQLAFFGRYQPTEQKSEVWSFFKLLMAQFNDMEFTNIIRDAVMERCRVKYQMQQQQRDEKRNSVVLGKKQRFHSWGGKRSGINSNDLEQEHNDEGNLSF
ncbi:leucokinin [Calliphora vicina]|uniref:leucokinin n=1 Tax=Calliphora vicina TaxID=7373 RepID=UPI00325BAA25